MIVSSRRSCFIPLQQSQQDDLSQDPLVAKVQMIMFALRPSATASALPSTGGTWSRRPTGLPGRHTESGFQGAADRATIVPRWRVGLWRDWFYCSVLLSSLLRASPEGTASLCCAAGLEGRAGMAAITPREGRRFDTAAFYQHVAKFLPNYARPRFIRVQVSHAALFGPAPSLPLPHPAHPAGACRTPWTSRAPSST